MSSVDQPQDGAVTIQQAPEPRHEAARKRTAASGPGELQVEELEERITPRLAANHNETLLSS